MPINKDEITEDSAFKDDLGADSLDIFQIITGIEILLISKLMLMRQSRLLRWEML